jgi:hypothetical protein
MPFDDTSPRTEPKVVAVGNTLASLGITPVPRDIAENHKKTMLSDYASWGHEEALKVSNGTAHWRTIYLSRTPIAKLQSSINVTLSSRYTTDQTRVPDGIASLARQVGNSIENAEFSVEYFDVDPILNVCYTDNLGRRHFDCLGIWDQGKIVAIASGGYTTEPRSKFLLASIAVVVAVFTVIGIAGLSGAFASQQPHHAAQPLGAHHHAA